MPNLIELNATWMNADLLESLVHLQKLERLSISRLQGSMSQDNMYFEPSFKGSPRIKELNMADSSQMTDSALVSITKTCSKLQVLNVSGNNYLTHEGLIRWCEQLQGSSRSVAATVVVVGMTELTTINFGNCNHIQSQGFQALFERSRHLQKVNLMSTRIEDTALQVLATQNSGLQTIILNCCPCISDQGLQTVLKTCRQLKVVSFLYCNRITVQVFFQNLWKCLEMEELRFSLNNRHLDLIEHGISNSDGGGGGGSLSSQNSEQQNDLLSNNNGLQTSKFYEPQLEFMIFGRPDPDDSLDADTVNRGQGSSSTLTSVQEYRRRLILTQIYRQIERLGQLQILDMRNIHLPLDLTSGLSRLGRLATLQVLELTGLEQPLGVSEIEWLASAMPWICRTTAPGAATSSLDERMQLQQDSCFSIEPSSIPLPRLRRLVFKEGHSMSIELLKKLNCCRPWLDVQLTQVREQFSLTNGVSTPE
ncbi:hypothetical protein BGZ65_002625 [Modicella reniformis]|uniref:Uncharacterized protein n=1 Tax=Modicella reniformis TaxID=1440133 RepID=A0A9P6IL17_9FUNG|nr:hypothetical protein BGZ65_002625 [Modicella reniformis]